MSRPKLSMRSFRRNPAVITNASDLQPEMDVVLGYVLPPIGRGERCAQALMGLIDHIDPNKIATSTRHEALKEGYNHTPTWGIVVSSVAKVNWINSTNSMWPHPYASLDVSRSAVDLSPSESMQYTVKDLAEVACRAQELPIVTKYDEDDMLVPSTYDLRVDFDQLGLAPEPYGLNKFVIDLSRLP